MCTEFYACRKVCGGVGVGGVVSKSRLVFRLIQVELYVSQPFYQGKQLKLLNFIQLNFDPEVKTKNICDA